jgi:peptidoglycan/xylan/chitin deacetylase (PgdA/CDA1 family)
VADEVFGVARPCAKAERKSVKAYSILYHDVFAGGDVERSGFVGWEAKIYKLDEPHFRAHLDKIAKATIGKPAAADELLFATAPSRSWMLHFDDGGISAVENIAPLLKERGWCGHFYIATDFVGQPGFVSREDIRELRRQGHVIGSHSCSHPDKISQLGWEDMVTEWRKSRDVLSEILGEEVTVASVPGGFYSPRVAEAAATAGVKMLFNSEPTSTPRHVGGCLVLGRYSILGDTPAGTAAALAAGSLTPRVNQFVHWNSKKAAKALLGKTYAKMRSYLLRD